MITVELKPYVHADEVANRKALLDPYRAVVNAPVLESPEDQKADTKLRLEAVEQAIIMVLWRRVTGRNAEESSERIKRVKAPLMKQFEEMLKLDDEQSCNTFEAAANLLEVESSHRMISNFLTLVPYLDSNAGHRAEDLLKGLSLLRRDYGHPTTYVDADEKTKREAAAVMDAAYSRKFARAKDGLHFISGGVSPIKDEALIKLAVEFAGEPGRLSRLMSDTKCVDPKKLRAALV